MRRRISSTGNAALRRSDRTRASVCRLAGSGWLRPGRRNLRASEPYIERAGSAVCTSGFLEAEHDRAQIGLAQPLRGEPFEHAALIGPVALVRRRAFAG